MTRQLMDAAAVEIELNRLYEEIETAEGEMGDLGQARAEADAGFKQAFALAILASSASSADKRKAEAESSTYEAYLALQVAEEKLKAKRAELSRMGTQLDVLRTLAANTRGI